jgi:hypothetical protein
MVTTLAVAQLGMRPTPKPTRGIKIPLLSKTLGECIIYRIKKA